MSEFELILGVIFVVTMVSLCISSKCPNKCCNYYCCETVPNENKCWFCRKSDWGLKKDEMYMFCEKNRKEHRKRKEMEEREKIN